MPIKAVDNPDQPEGKRLIHAIDPMQGGEFTMCSFSIDEWKYNNLKMDYVDKSKSITCIDCISMIESRMKAFKKNRGKWREV